MVPDKFPPARVVTVHPASAATAVGEGADCCGETVGVRRTDCVARRVPPMELRGDTDTRLVGDVERPVLLLVVAHREAVRSAVTTVGDGVNDRRAVTIVREAELLGVVEGEGDRERNDCRGDVVRVMRMDCVARRVPPMEFNGVSDTRGEKERRAETTVGDELKERRAVLTVGDVVKERRAVKIVGVALNDRLAVATVRDVVKVREPRGETEDVAVMGMQSARDDEPSGLVKDKGQRVAVTEPGGQ